MLISISGSQGSGKSTILSELSDLGQNVITRKTSRSILSEWGVTLEEVNNNRELTLRFQDEIVIRKARDEVDALVSDEVWFTERTYADLFSYALISLGKDNVNSEWIDEYYKTCKSYQKSYSKVFYIEAGIFDVEFDGVRGSNPHYSIMVDLVMEKYTRSMTPILSGLHNITSPDLKDRVDLIMNTVYNS